MVKYVHACFLNILGASKSSRIYIWAHLTEHKQMDS